MDGARHRAVHRRALRRQREVRRHGVLERPDGRVRARAVRGRHARGGRGDRGHRGHHGRRRRRLRGRARAVRPRRPTSTTSRPAAARRWSSSRASRCPAWRRCHEPHAVHRRQLEDAQDDRRGGGVHRGAAAAGGDRRRRRRGDLPAVHRAAGDGRLGPRLARAGVRAEHARGRLRRVHRRDLGADAAGDRRPGRDPRPLRAAPVLQRDRQGAPAEGARRRSTRA